MYQGSHALMVVNVPILKEAIRKFTLFSFANVLFLFNFVSVCNKVCMGCLVILPSRNADM